jgi:hypothetical protein
VIEFRGVHDTILHDDTPEIDCEGARMCGKTWLFSAKVLRAAEAHPGMWWLINRYSGTETDNQLRPVFRDVARLLDIPIEWHGDESAYWLREKDQQVSKVFAYGLKTQAKDERFAKVRGSGVHGLWNDQSEETPEDIGTEMRALIRKPGAPHQLLLSPNPPGEEHYLADQFPEGISDHLRKYYRLSLYDNRHNLSPDTIEKLERLYPPSHAKHKSLILGMRGPNVTGTPVYDHAFSRPLHIGPVTIDQDLPLYEAFHAGQHHPTWIVAQRSPYGALNVVAGIIGKRLLLEDFLPIVATYRQEWFPWAKNIRTCCDPPASEATNRYSIVSILRDWRYRPVFRPFGASPDVRVSMIEFLGGLMRRRAGTEQAFMIADEPKRWLMASHTLPKPKQTKLFMDACEGSYVWSPLYVSVGNKTVRQPQFDEWLEGFMRCLENIALNFCVSQKTLAEQEAERMAAAQRQADAGIALPSGPHSWMGN